MQLLEFWHAALRHNTRKGCYEQLASFVEVERRTHTVFPPEDNVFAALEMTPLEQTSVLQLGQAPITMKAMHTVCASLCKLVSNFRNHIATIYKALSGDVGIDQ